MLSGFAFSSPPAIRFRPPRGAFPSDSHPQILAAGSPNSPISTTASGRALLSAASARELFPVPIAAISNAGISRPEFTNIRMFRQTSLRYSCSPKAKPPMAQVLSTGKPEGRALSAWNWSYPAGGGDYAALYPKSWFAYRSPQLPVNPDGRTVLSHPAQQLQGNQLSGCSLQLVCGESIQQAGDGFASVFLDQHGGLVSRYQQQLQCGAERSEQKLIPLRIALRRARCRA